jgi:hypothetical protein
MSRTFSNASDSFDGLDRTNLVSAFSGVAGFNPDTSAINSVLNFRGIPMTITFDANSNNAVLNIPGIVSNRLFTGANRDEAMTKLEDFFKKDGGDIINQLFRKAAETTAIDPIAGNPNSLMSRTVATSFDRGFSNQVSQVQANSVTPTAAGSSNNNLIAIGARYSSFKADGYKSQSVNLPLSYTVRFDRDARQQIVFNLPLDYNDTEGAQTFGAGLGVGYSHPLTKYWVLTPAVDYGLVGSMDLASAGQGIAFSLTSASTLPVGKVLLNMGNMVGYSQTLKVSVGDYSFDPQIKNTVIKNGLMVYLPTEMMIADTGVEVFFIDTRFFGTKLYNEYYDEVGLSYGFSKTTTDGKRNKFADLRIGATYTFAKNNDGFMVNFGYTF